MSSSPAIASLQHTHTCARHQDKASYDHAVQGLGPRDRMFVRFPSSLGLSTGFDKQTAYAWARETPPRPGTRSKMIQPLLTIDMVRMNTQHCFGRKRRVLAGANPSRAQSPQRPLRPWLPSRHPTCREATWARADQPWQQLRCSCLLSMRTATPGSPPP